MESRELGRLLFERVFAPYAGSEFDDGDAADLVQSLADTLMALFMTGKEVKIGHLGKFDVHTTAAGRQWDPSLKKTVARPEKVRLRFRASGGTCRMLQTMKGK